MALGVPRAHPHRTEIEGLYVCGASASGGISAAPGYNAFKVIAQDHDLPEIWKRDDRIY
jgi:phytoene dehydrogenase-like protein